MGAAVVDIRINNAHVLSNNLAKPSWELANLAVNRYFPVQQETHPDGCLASIQRLFAGYST